MHFHLIMAAKEIEAFLVVPVHLLITEIMFLPFDSLRERLASYDNNNFCVECRGGGVQGGSGNCFAELVLHDENSVP